MCGVGVEVWKVAKFPKTTEETYVCGACCEKVILQTTLVYAFSLKKQEGSTLVYERNSFGFSVQILITIF